MLLPRILKNHFLVSAVIFCVLLLLILILLVIPTVREIRRINNEVFSERRRLENLYSRGQLQKRVLGRYNEAKEKSEFLDEIFLTENQELQYIKAVEAQADRTGVRLKIAVGAADSTALANISKLLFTFEARGDWPALLTWLQKVEELPYYTNFSDATVVSQVEKDSTRAVTILKLNAETYWLKP